MNNASLECSETISSLKKEISLPYKVTQEISTESHLFFLSEALYTYNYETQEIRLINKECTSFDIFEDNLAIGTKKGKICIQSIKTEKEIKKFHWHNSFVQIVKFDKKGKKIFSVSSKNCVHIFYLKTNDFRIIDFFTEIKEINVKKNILEVKSNFLKMTYDTKIEEIKYKIKGLKNFLINYKRIIKEEVKRNEVPFSSDKVKTKGIFQETKTEKYFLEEKIQEKRELIFLSERFLVFYNLGKKCFFSKEIKAEKAFLNDYLVVKEKNKVKIYDENYSFILEKEIEDLDFEKIIFFKNRLYFLKKNEFWEERISGKRLLEENVKNIFTYLGNLIILDTKGLKHFGSNDYFYKKEGIKEVKVRMNKLIIHYEKTVVVYENGEEECLVCESLVDFDYEECLLVLMEEGGEKIFLKKSEKVVVPGECVSVLSSTALLNDKGEIHFLE